MPTYEYQGRNAEGKSVSGRRLSQSPDNLSLQLLKDGIIPVRIVVTGAKENAFETIRDFFRGRRLNLEELGMFARQMNTLCKSGVSITTGLRQLAENTRSLRMSNALNGMVERLESGVDLATAMQDHPKLFTPIMISMIKVGQNTGHLDEAFLRLNQYLELEGTALGRTKAALRYPTFILIAIIVAIFVVNIFVIPTFSKVFAAANVPLPAVTKALIGFSNFLVQDWVVILVIFISIFAAIYYYLHTPTGTYNWHKYQLRIPIVGPIIRRILLLRFAQSFAVIARSGIALVEGISLVAQSVDNVYASQEILTLHDAIQHGKSLTQAVAASPLFTTLEIQMLSVSEETGELANMLDQVAVYYRREVEYDLKRLSDVIEPFLITGLALVILMLAFAVYLPIWNMVKLAH